MSEDEVMTNETATEAGETQTSETPASPLEALAQDITQSMEQNATKRDPLEEYGIEAEHNSSGEDSADDGDTKAQNSYQKLQRQIAELREENKALSERGKVKEILEKISTDYPGANLQRLQEPIRKGYSATQIEIIAKGSHGDYMRGVEETEQKWAKKVEAAIAAEKQRIETETQDAWGQPPSSGTSSADGALTPEEFQERLKKGKLTDAQASELLKKVKWTQF